MRRIGRILWQVGLVVLVLHTAWWAVWHWRAADKIPGIKFGDLVPCLWSSGGKCRLVHTVGDLTDKPPYEPMIFWAALVAILLGVILTQFARRRT